MDQPVQRDRAKEDQFNATHKGVNQAQKELEALKGGGGEGKGSIRPLSSGDAEAFGGVSEWNDSKPAMITEGTFAGEGGKDFTVVAGRDEDGKGTVQLVVGEGEQVYRLTRPVPEPNSAESYLKQASSFQSITDAQKAGFRLIGGTKYNITGGRTGQTEKPSRQGYAGRLSGGTSRDAGIGRVGFSPGRDAGIGRVGFSSGRGR
jgi:hypothetical protein